MIFACCHPLLTRENQLALTLKTLCGFGTTEIARALLVNEETIKKRLQRATKDLIDHHISLDAPDAAQLIDRLDAVHQVLYLIFNEGHSSSRGEAAIRTDLCEDAAYLCHLLCTHPHCSTPTTRALMALMLFHAARLDARLDERGGVLLMEDQDRTRWDQPADPASERVPRSVSRGNRRSPSSISKPESPCITARRRTYADTDWPAILRLYDAMLTIHRSPVYLINRAIAVAEIAGPLAGIKELTEMTENVAILNYHLFDATLGELYRRAGHLDQAQLHLEAARLKTRSVHDQAIIDRRLERCRSDTHTATFLACQPRHFFLVIFSNLASFPDIATREPPNTGPFVSPGPIKLSPPSVASIPRRNSFLKIVYDLNPILTPRLQSALRRLASSVPSHHDDSS